MRNFHSFRRMTRRSSTCRSALLMVLPKRRNNLHISTLPGVLSVISVHQRLSMAQMLVAGAGSGAAGSGAAGSGFMGASGAGSGAGSGFMGASGAGSGAAGSGASMPSFLIRLRRWLSRCVQAFALFTSSSPFVRSARRRVPPGADPWPPSPSQRRCLSAVRQPRSRRRAGARVPRARRESPSQSFASK